MGTIGNLELRLNNKTFQASATHDGCNVYESISKLVQFLDTTKNPANSQFESWFKDVSMQLCDYNYNDQRLGGMPEEVIIDVPRKLVLHTGSSEYPDTFMNACIILHSRHHYQILQFEKPRAIYSQNDLGYE